jgi:hypothetical protein
MDMHEFLIWVEGDEIGGFGGMEGDKECEVRLRGDFVRVQGQEIGESGRLEREERGEKGSKLAANWRVLAGGSDQGSGVSDH